MNIDTAIRIAADHFSGQRPRDVTMDIDGRLPERVQERLREAPGNAQQAMDAMAASDSSRAMFGKASNALAQCNRSSKAKKAIFWMHEAGEHLSRAVTPHSACKDQCSHCCHIPVLISRVEAVHIGRAIGRNPVNLPNSALGFETTHRAGYNNPCSFLSKGKCSIYEHRPAACRTLFNMDKDATLCELQDAAPTQVPYFNASAFTLIQAAMSRGLLADVRDWFPKALKP